MTQSPVQGEIAAPQSAAGFVARPASQTWERISFADCPQAFAWVWLKPQNVPHGLILMIPEETYRVSPQFATQLTMRRLLQAAGIEPGWVSMWNLYGVAYDGMHGTSPFLDHPIPLPVMGADPNIVVCINAAPVVHPVPAANPVPVVTPVPVVNAPPVDAMPQPPPASDPKSSSAEPATVAEVFKRIDDDWNASLVTEKELKRLRKQLLEMAARLKTLNRNFSPQERLHSSPQDKKDWLDARRWLRDSSTRLSRYIKEHDIGYTSAAGQRKWFEQTYQQYIVPRQQFDGLRQAHRDYATYRKVVVTLQTNMNTAYAQAAQNGERRAQQILTRVAAKVREATTKRNALGILCD